MFGPSGPPEEQTGNSPFPTVCRTLAPSSIRRTQTHEIISAHGGKPRRRELPACSFRGKARRAQPPLQLFAKQAWDTPAPSVQRRRPTDFRSRSRTRNKIHSTSSVTQHRGTALQTVGVGQQQATQRHSSNSPTSCQAAVCFPLTGVVPICWHAAACIQPVLALPPSTDNFVLLPTLA